MMQKTGALSGNNSNTPANKGMRGRAERSWKPWKPARVIAAAALAMAAALALYAGFAYAAEPGSTGDPIALKSYVDARISELETRLTALIGGGDQTAASGGRNPASGAAPSQASPAAGDTLSAQLEELTRKVDALTADNAALRRSVRQLTAADGGSADGVPPDMDDGVDGSGKTVSGTGITAAPSAGGLTVAEFKSGERIILDAGTEMILRSGEALAIRGELGCVLDLVTGRDLDAGDTVPVNHLLISARDDSRGVRIEKDAFVMLKGSYTLR